MVPVTGEALRGKVAWVTGAGSGIGEAAAIALAAAGAIVALTGRRREPLEAVATRIGADGGTALVEPGDATDRDAMMAIAGRLSGAHGRIDILFNNHGINVTERTWADARYDDWDRVIDVNVKGAYNCVGAVLPIMRASGDGVIINTASKAGWMYSPIAGVAYGASKHAVMALNALINEEEGRNGIRATVIAPGEVATPILDRRPVPVSAEARAKLVQPEDVAALVLFIATMHPRARLDEVLITPSVPRVKSAGEP